jgi:tRNA pseudouridine38-40 synthase
LALIVEYDGTCYAGFQLQSQHPTIQGAIETALTRFTGEDIRIRGASRTDAGAHAQGQVVDFATASPHPVERFPPALNHYLPVDVEVQAAYQMAWDFHSRRDAASRTYRYRILNRPWPSPIRRNSHHWVREPLDTAMMNSAAQHLVGVHDFRPLATGHPADKSAVRWVNRWSVTAEDDSVVIECEANGFLRHQIRRANAILVEIGKGRWPENAIEDALENGLPTTGAWPSLPACGLCLMTVKYSDFWDKVKQTHETD